MRTIDKSTLGLDKKTLGYAADDLWQELNAIERCYPHVLDDGAYQQLKQTCTEFAYRVPAEDDLNGLYMAIIECLRVISVQTTNIASLVARKGGIKLLSDYLPPTFEDFIDKVTEAKLRAEYYENAYEGTAQALLMAELKDGIDAVVPSHREAVKESIYEMLFENADGNEGSIAALERTNTADILKLIGIEDDFDLLVAGIDQGFRKVAEIILAIREEIKLEYMDVDTAELKLKSPGGKEFAALGSGMRKLLLAMAQDRPRYGDAKELGRAHRMEFASRITRPSLKVVEDKRLSVMDAKRHGLTPLEIKVLLMSGYLKVPSDDEPLERHDPDMPIEGTVGTLDDLERLALTYAAMQPDSGRTDN